MVKNSNVAVVVVTYNRFEKLKVCINRLKNMSVSADIIVVDNASTDGTTQWVKEQGENGVLASMCLNENIGGAGGFNAGVRRAVAAGYDYIWLMDDDCFVQQDSLAQLQQVDRILNGQYGWLSSVALWTDGTPCLMNKQKLHNDAYSGFDKLKYGIIRATQATFVSLYIKSEVVKNVGLPVKDFFIWGDDIEYTRRIAVRNDIPSYIVGTSIVIHDMKENSGSNIAIDNPERISRYRYAYRNEGYLFRKEGFKGIMYFFAKCSYNLVRIMIHARSKRLLRMRTLTASAFMGFFFNPTIEYVK